MKSLGRLLCLVAAQALGSLMVFAQDAMSGQDPQKQPAPTADDARRDTIQKNLEAMLKGADVRVTIELRASTVEDAVEQFRSQVKGVDFILDPTNIPADYKVDLFIVRDKPWREAFEMFMAKAQLMVDDERSGMVRFSRPPRVTFALKEADIQSVVDLIARISRANIILAPTVKGTISLTVNEVPWSVVLEQVVKTLGNYTVVREKFDILRIVHADELKKQLETRVYSLKYLQPPPMYRAKISENAFFSGKLLPASNSIEELKKGFTFIRMLEATLTLGVGRLDYDFRSNSVTVNDTKIVLDRITEIVKELDVEPAQVVIDVKFISTGNEDLLEWGMKWSSGDFEGIQIGTSTLPPVGAARDPITRIGVNPGVLHPFYDGTAVANATRLPFGLGKSYNVTDQYFLTSYDMSATFRAFRKDKYSKLVQQPSLSVLDNEEATIFVGESIPYAESRAIRTEFGGLEYTIGAGGQSPISVGFQILVVPRIIRKDNKVLLTVIPVNNFLNGKGPLAGFDRFELPGAGQNGADARIDLPRVATSTVITRLMVESGRTAVMGGMVSERTSTEESKLPLLGDIPLLNVLFKQRKDTVNRDHLLVFVTPRIVRSARESEQQLRDQLRELEKEERAKLEDLRMKKADEDTRRADDEKMKRAAEELQQLRQPK